MDKNELKVQALLQRVQQLTTRYENENADLRVELTIVTYENEALKAQLESLTNDQTQETETTTGSD